MVTDDLTTIFSDVAQQLEPDHAAMVSEAIRRGRRTRTRRRIAIALSAGAAVLLVAVAAALGSQLAGRSIRGTQPATHGEIRGHHGHRNAKLGLKLRPHHRKLVPQEHGPGMTAGSMLSVLRTLLPAGHVTAVIPYEPHGGVEVNFNDADGKGAVDVSVGVYPSTEGPGNLGCPNPPLTDEGKRPAGAPPIGCTRSVLHNGEIVMKEYTEADVAGYFDLAVYVARPDGVTVSIDVGNGTLEGTPHEGRQYWPWVDRPVPPGSFKVWEKVVRSPKWHL
jgi:hypothetical protein